MRKWGPVAGSVPSHWPRLREWFAELAKVPTGPQVLVVRPPSGEAGLDLIVACHGFAVRALRIGPRSRSLASSREPPGP